ncbi:hypothetical protein D3C77_359850 [compost metagenome]
MLQQRPARPVGGVIDDALHLHWPTLQAYLDAPAWQYIGDCWLLHQPGIDQQALCGITRSYEEIR